MKKNFVRIVAALLVAMLALTLLPVGALALDVTVWSEAYGSHPSFQNWSNAVGVQHSWDSGIQVGHSSVTIKTSDYDSYIVMSDGCEYDLKGIVDYNELNEWDFNSYDMGRNVPLTSSLTFTEEDYPEGAWAWLVYLPHQHKLSCWYSDGTTHWRECLVCRENFMYQNWCQDGDEDGICNVCGGDVPYHDVTVIEEEGGKITVNKETASHRTKITADVEPAEGYKLKKLHFTKIRDDGSEQEITRYKKDGQFWTYMPTYDLEVSAEFVKK